MRWFRMLERNTSGSHSATRLATRRRLRRRRLSIALFILALFVLGALVWGLWQPAVRITHVTVSTGDTRVEAAATTAIAGSYLGIIPHNSTFFFQAGSVRRAVLASDASIAAVSVARSGLTGVVITPIAHAPIAQWCGVAPAASENCYVFDTSGYIFEAIPLVSLDATSTPTLPAASNPFKIYGPLAASSTEPLGATIAQSPMLPSMLDFARQLGTLGTPVTSIVIRGREVDDLLVSGTRVTYLLGAEEDALAALVSAKNNLNLLDGSLEYVDLRFPGKVYALPKATKVGG